MTGLQARRDERSAAAAERALRLAQAWAQIPTSRLAAAHGCGLDLHAVEADALTPTTLEYLTRACSAGSPDLAARATWQDVATLWSQVRARLAEQVAQLHAEHGTAWVRLSARQRRDLLSDPAAPAALLVQVVCQDPVWVGPGTLVIALNQDLLASVPTPRGQVVPAPTGQGWTLAGTLLDADPWMDLTEVASVTCAAAA